MTNFGERAKKVLALGGDHRERTDWQVAHVKSAVAILAEFVDALERRGVADALALHAKLNRVSDDYAVLQREHDALMAAARELDGQLLTHGTVAATPAHKAWNNLRRLLQPKEPKEPGA